MRPAAKNGGQNVARTDVLPNKLAAHHADFRELTDDDQ
jgi:hypothetical protein